MNSPTTTDMTAVPTVAAITIPADYLDDLRAAFVAEIVDTSAALKTNHAENAAPADLAWPMRLVAEDLTLLRELIGAEGETKLEGPDDALWCALEAMCRIVTARIIDEMQYSPLSKRSLLDLTARLRWAACEATRIDPHPDDELDQEGGA
jgi:hypothetical protein